MDMRIEWWTYSHGTGQPHSVTFIESVRREEHLIVENIYTEANE